jgi:hypothetical protein
MKKQFASGGKRPMLGKGDRTKTAFPAEPQKPGQTAQHSGKTVPRPAVKRTAKAPINEAGSMGGSAGAAKPRLPAA